ncbi:MAG: phosphotransferase [Sphaerobacteraceae bacterium]|nr:MAG: phosphotransferase [Sphaerobacteraceae bacterium]
MMSLPFRQPGRFFRGNLHAHSTESDGALDPASLIDAYRRNGYDFIAVTDHFRDRFGFPVTDTREYRDSEFTTILGAELHPAALENGEDWHILAVGLPLNFPAASPDEDGPTLSQRARDAGAFVAIAHPHWYSATMNDARSIEAAHAVEIFNMTCHMANDRGYGWYMADLLLAEGRKILAIATDDTHAKPERPDMFAGWVMVKAEHLDPDSLLDAIKAGHFYSSQGPLIHDIAISDDRSTVTLETSPVSSIQVCGRAQRTRDVHGNGMTSCTIDLDRVQNDYFRVTVIDSSGKRAWSNPIWLD